jgi:hypothetical protein
MLESWWLVAFPGGAILCVSLAGRGRCWRRGTCPALGGRLDHPDVEGLAAPKPMLFLSGRQDRHSTSTSPGFRVMIDLTAVIGSVNPLTR